MDKQVYRKRRNNYNSNYRKKIRFNLESGLKGFICTCNGKEKDCIRESYNILNEYADRIYEEEKKGIQGTGDNAEGEQSGEIEDELQKEVESLKPDNKGRFERRFQCVDTGVPNCIFIKATVDDPVKLAHMVLKDVDETHQQKARFLLRLLPIEVTCKAYLDDIKKAADSIFDSHFKGEPTTFSVTFNTRYNNSVLRDEVIESLAKLVTDRNSDHRVDLKHSAQTIVVELIKGTACLAVVPNYFALRKYNMMELANPKEETNTEAGNAESKPGEGGAEQSAKEPKNGVTEESEDTKTNQEQIVTEIEKAVELIGKRMDMAKEAETEVEKEKL